MRVPWTAVPLLLFLLAVGLVAVRLGRGPELAESRPEHPLDPDLFLVTPFETHGASPELQSYGQGMVDLIGARLAGSPHPRAIDARAALTALAERERRKGGPLELEDVRSEAVRLGAGGVLRGSVVGTPSALVVTARLIDVETGEIRAKATVDSVVAGPGAVSPLALVDRLVARLLTLDAGEPPTRLATLSPSFPAVQDYLAGKRAYRAGRIREAHDLYDRALDHDSTFVLAVLGLEETCQGWSGIPPCYERAKRLGWKYADALNRTDRLYLRVVAGEDLRSPDDIVRFEAAAAARAAAAERVETRFEWADELLHVPAKVSPEGDVQASWDRAESELAGILADEPGFEPALDHLVRLKLGRGDWAAVDSLASEYAVRFPDADGREAMAWWRAWLRRGRIGSDSLRVRLANTSSAALERLILPSFFIPGMGLSYASRALDELEARGEAGDELRKWTRYRIAMNLGRPQEAREYLRGHWIEQLDLVKSALYSIGDSAVAAGVVADLSATLEAPLPPTDDIEAIGDYNRNVCISEEWRLWHGETATAARSIRRLRKVLPADSTWDTTGEARECPILLDAILAVVAERPDARRAVERLDAHKRRTDGGTHVYYFHLAAARLWKRLGEPARALVSVRNRCRFCGGFRYPADEHRIEARLLAKLGRTDEAIRAFEHYLSLRSDPEPSVRPQVDSVRTELRRLRAEASRQGRPPDSPPSRISLSR